MNRIRPSCFALLVTLVQAVSASVLSLVLSSGNAVAAGHGDDPILHWNAVALQAVKDDHSGTFGAPDQGGPTRTARALAIVHIAMYDATNAIDGSFEPYLPVASPTAGASVDAAVAQAAHDTLAALYPSQAAVFDQELQRVHHGVPVLKGRAAGVAVGAESAENILIARFLDGSADGDVPIYPPTSDPPLPGEHQPDPLNLGQGLLTPGWGAVLTFSGINVTDPGVRVPAPPALTDSDYTNAFLDVLLLGGDGDTTPTLRTQEETEIGLFWAYDGTIGLGTPPVLYNKIARVVARQEGNSRVENARLFALANIAMADAGIACWDGKYLYNFWRPVVGIRNAGSDGNPDTEQVEDWTPLGAPASNESGTNFTPPFPAYASGHATFGAALFRTLANFYGTDDIAFQLSSDEMSGRTTDSEGRHRRTVIRRFERFSDAALENGRSRIFLGIHWQFDADAGIAQGVTVADYLFENLLEPL